MLRFALRNLTRNRWRTGLTLGGIAAGVALLIWTQALIDSYLWAMVRGATTVVVGQAQIHHPDYADTPSIYDHFAFDDELRTELESIEGVDAVCARVHAFGLVGNEERSSVARLVGVEPDAEARVSPLETSLSDGTWLPPVSPEYPAARPVVLGIDLARQLEVEPGDELVLFLQGADGSLANDLLEVAGILHTGTTEVDRMTVYMHINDLSWLAAVEGRVHEVTFAIPDFEEVPQIVDAATQRVRAHGLSEDDVVVRSWDEVLVELSTMIEGAQGSVAFMYFIIYALVALGIVNTQRMSALERHRELGVLQAIGMKPSRIARMLLVEATLLAALGGFAGAVLGLAVVGYHHTVGLDMAAMAGGATDLQFMGISFSDRLYLPLEFEYFATHVTIVVLLGAACGVFPAWRAYRIDPPRAISGRS